MRPLIAFFVGVSIFLTMLTASAQTVIWDLEAGLYSITVENGEPVVNRVIVRRLDDQPDPKPEPKPEPNGDDDPPPPEGFARLTQISSEQYTAIPDDEFKQILAATVATVYRSVAAGLRDGSINVAQAGNKVSEVRNILPNEWADWQTATSAEWNSLQDKAIITNPETWAAGLEAIANGLISPAAIQQLEEAELLDNPMVGQLLQIILTLIGGDSDIARWLPVILSLLRIILGGV